MDTQSVQSEVTIKKIDNGYVLRWEPEAFNIYGPIMEYYTPTVEGAVLKLKDILG